MYICSRDQAQDLIPEAHSILEPFCEIHSHLIAKDKVAEQHILGKHSNCNNFGVTMALLKLQTRK